MPGAEPLSDKQEKLSRTLVWSLRHRNGTKLTDCGWIRYQDVCRMPEVAKLRVDELDFHAVLHSPVKQRIAVAYCEGTDDMLYLRANHGHTNKWRA